MVINLKLSCHKKLNICWMKSKGKEWTNKAHSNPKTILTARTVQITTILNKIIVRETRITKVKTSSQETKTWIVTTMAQIKTITWKMITEMLKIRKSIIDSILKDAGEKRRVMTKLPTCIIWSLLNMKTTLINIDLLI